jgi:DNA-binding transcriptional regulator YdaS (Cro superfamily)
MSIRQLLLSAGGYAKIGRALQIPPNTVAYWGKRGRIPARHVLAVEKATGVSRHDLDEKLYPREKKR